MATLSVQDLTAAGLNATYNSAGAGDQFTNDGATFLHVKNGSGSSVTVTLTAQKTSIDDSTYGVLTISDATVSVPGSGDRFFGPFPPAVFNDANGKAQISYSATSSVTVAVLRSKKRG
jgi:hypothetical protein